MPEPYRLLITGSRNWPDDGSVGEAIYETLAGRHDPVIVIVHGACLEGADAQASAFCRTEAEWFAQNGQRLVEERHPAERKRFRGQAGPIRNAHMVALGAQVCLAFVAPCVSPKCRTPEPHGSHGATGCALLAEQAGIRVERWPR